jgi:hypothetical protein
MIAIKILAISMLVALGWSIGTAAGEALIWLAKHGIDRLVTWAMR